MVKYSAAYFWLSARFPTRSDQNLTNSERSCVVTVAQQSSVTAAFREERFLDWGIIWMCQFLPDGTSRDQAPCGLSFPRLGPFHLALANNSPPTCSHRNQGQETRSLLPSSLPRKATGDTRTKNPLPNVSCLQQLLCSVFWNRFLDSTVLPEHGIASRHRG